MSSRLLWSFALVAAFALAGCGAHYPSEVQGSNGTTATSGDSAGNGGSGGTGSCTKTWDSYGGTFFQTRCNGCHGVTVQLPLFSNQDKVTAAASAILSAVNANRMPPGAPLSASDKAALTDYLTCQAGGTGSTGGTTATTTGTTGASTGGTGGGCSDTWANYGSGFFQTNCNRCHGPVVATPTFPNEAAVIANAATIQADVYNGKMPTDTTLSHPDRQRLVTYIACITGQVLPDGGPIIPDGGFPEVDGGSSICSNPPDPTYTSATWSGDGYLGMLPGENCLGCHSPGKSGPTWRVGGTIFGSPTADKSQGLSGVAITLVDANNNTFHVNSGSAGNFYIPPPRRYSDGGYSGPNPTPPYAVSLTHNGITRQMAAKAPNGACNTCHTQPAECGAPGRVNVP